MSISARLRQQVWQPLLNLLRQGVSPGQLAWSTALGAYLGIIPMLGVTTALCTMVALPLRLNLVAIQAVNWLVYPLQILLIIPFFRGGERLFGQPSRELAPSELMALFKADLWGAMASLWSTTWHALVVWFLIGIPFVAVSNIVLRVLFTRLADLRPAEERKSKALPS